MHKLIDLNKKAKTEIIENQTTDFPKINKSLQISNQMQLEILTRTKVRSLHNQLMALMTFSTIFLLLNVITF